MRVALFDIDGTLLHAHGAGRRALSRALAAETGISDLDRGYHFDGKTDPQIIRDLLHRAGRAASPECVASVCRGYLAMLVEELPKGPAPEALPGVSRLLDTLEREAGILLGLLTGNLQDGARLKLDAAGIGHARFPVGAYGSDALDRGELPSFARRRATALLGREVLASELVIIGDTPADVDCGRGAGATTIAVATGRFDVATLTASGADHVLSSLEDEGSLLAAILG